MPTTDNTTITIYADDRALLAANNDPVDIITTSPTSPKSPTAMVQQMQNQNKPDKISARYIHHEMYKLAAK
jgi:hypothetical protein